MIRTILNRTNSYMVKNYNNNNNGKKIFFVNGKKTYNCWNNNYMLMRNNNFNNAFEKIERYNYSSCSFRLMKEYGGNREVELDEIIRNLINGYREKNENNNDNKPVKITKNNLKLLLRDRKLKTSGSKKEMIDRLMKYEEENEEKNEEEDLEVFEVDDIGDLYDGSSNINMIPMNTTNDHYRGNRYHFPNTIDSIIGNDKEGILIKKTNNEMNNSSNDDNDGRGDSLFDTIYEDVKGLGIEGSGRGGFGTVSNGGFF
eukprot:TRINITY_DN3669_c0_g2_i1.p1 TRINITY_DN3669_c0_g2~~TRINITY_DN3669_c0_g2_i1.p1  ORF type:complete len:257 (-),score=59.52 TRINITY_DN3669_c0_g2_i1:227-997(-)